MKFEAYILAFMLVAPLSLSAQQGQVPPELAELDASMTAAAKADTNTAPDALTSAATPDLTAAMPATEPVAMPTEAPITAATNATAETEAPITAAINATAETVDAPAADAVPGVSGTTAASGTNEPPVPSIVEAGAVGDTSEFTPLPVAPVLPDNVTGESTGENLITIALDNVELIDVVRMFSRIANANIIATPSNLTARVTANLDNVAWRPALSSILAQHSLSLIEKPQGSGVFSISTQAPDAPEPMIVETIFLDYTTVDEVSPVIERVLAGKGTISTFPSRNAMVVRTTESKLSEIRFIIKDIDIQSQQVCIETQFMELSDSAVKQLGIRWDSLENLGVGFQAGPFVNRDNLDHTTSRNDQMNRADRRSSSDTLDQRYDMYGNQYQAETVSIVERPDGSFIETYSIEPTRQINRAVELSQDVTSEIADNFTRTITESSAAILNVDSLNLVLSALKKTDGVSIVSNPKVIVANGTTNAFFRVGQREPIITQTIRRGTTDSPGDQITATLDTSTDTDYIKNGYLHTGIELRVVPTVKIDNLIEAQIEPSLRRKVGDKTVEGNSWPIISVKEIKTKFTLSSGQTVAIGGLTDTTDSKQTSKIPLLGDIPILGKYLFSHTKDAKSQIETIIFVSLTLVEPKALKDDEGLPKRAELVHKAMIKDEIRQRETQDEIRRLRKAADDLEKSRKTGKREPK
jgi:type IV pilus assembly protein PilQ